MPVLDIFKEWPDASGNDDHGRGEVHSGREKASHDVAAKHGYKKLGAPPKGYGDGTSFKGPNGEGLHIHTGGQWNWDEGPKGGFNRSIDSGTGAKSLELRLSKK